MPTIPVLLALAGVAEATNVIVPTQQPNVTSAVAALVGPGPHTIQIVVDNTYDEVDTIDVSGKDVTISGTGSANTVIRVLNPVATEVFRANGGRLVLSNLTVTGDITAQQTGLGLVDNLCFFANDRVGVNATNATVEVYDAELRCFFAQGAGGAIRAVNGGGQDVIVERSHFEQNLALGSGGHLYVGGSTVTPPDVTVTNSTFTYGFSAGDGGAVALGNVRPSVRNNHFSYNDSVVRGGAVSIASSVSGTTEIYENTFEQNLSFANLSFTVFDFDEQFDTGGITGDINFNLITGDGGAVYVDAEDVDVWANLFCGNFSDVGGAVHLADPNLSTVQNNVFNDNWAIHYGGGLYVRADSGIADPNVWNNTFNANSGGTTLPPTSSLVVYGGGGHAFFDGTVADIHNNIFSHSQHGGGVGGVDGANYTVGDPLIMEYNLWYSNLEDYYGLSDLVGDYDSHTLNQTNVIGADPMTTWVGFGDLDCYPDAFYPEWGSPTYDRGDPTDPAWADIDGTPNDIGYTGGSRATTLDQDGDGYMNTLDCNDHDANVNPGANEVCDLQDNDCDGEVDEGTPNIWYLDQDGDNYGTDDPTVSDRVRVTCTPPLGYVSEAGDCDDANTAIHPGATEICDGIDNDCNSTVDDEELLTYAIYYVDADGDGWGVGGGIEDCAPPDPTGWVLTAGDCNDGDLGINPNAAEACDQIDNDCDGLIDNDAVDALTWYPDSDGDTYGLAGGSPTTGCELPETGAATNDLDCADNDVDVNPAADELCDNIDNDCDGIVDDDPANAPDAEKYYADADGDGFLDEENALVLCPGAEVPDGYEAKGSADFDCDPEDPLNQSEKCIGCGCTTTPSAPGTGFLALLGGLLVTLRRRRD